MKGFKPTFIWISPFDFQQGIFLSTSPQTYVTTCIIGNKVEFSLRLTNSTPWRRMDEWMYNSTH